MTSDALITGHYSRPDLLAAIEAGLAQLGKQPDSIAIDDLAVVDEFHTGGRVATDQILTRLELQAGMRVLDVGSGLGGPARYCAATFGCQVTGIDLTKPYVDVASELTTWVGLADLVNFQVASAQEFSPAEPFDAAYLFHVGMNLKDKAAVFGGIARALRPGGRLAVYDLMQATEGDLTYPLPWATTEDTSWVASRETYEAALTEAGFGVVSTQDHAELARSFVAAIRDQAPSAGGPPPLGLHLLMGPDTGTKVGNLLEVMDRGVLSPVEIIGALPG